MYGEEPETTDAVIIAAGPRVKRLGLEREAEYWQSGIGVCPLCDGAVPILKNKSTAAEEAIYQTKYDSYVYILVR